MQALEQLDNIGCMYIRVKNFNEVKLISRRPVFRIFTACIMFTGVGNHAHSTPYKFFVGLFSWIVTEYPEATKIGPSENSPLYRRYKHSYMRA